MATVAFLIDVDRGDFELRPAIAERLVGLGVTNLSLFRDRDTLCLVLDGWAFDPSSSAAAAAAIGVPADARSLHPVMQTALRADP